MIQIYETRLKEWWNYKDILHTHTLKDVKNIKLTDEDVQFLFQSLEFPQGFYTGFVIKKSLMMKYDEQNASDSVTKVLIYFYGTFWGCSLWFCCTELHHISL